MLSIAITGGIGCGKTTVLRLCSKKFPIIDSDKIVADLYKNKVVRTRIKKVFGTTNKKELSEIIFSNKSERKKLERILHPLVLKEIKKRLSKFKKQKKQFVFIEVPLLFESSFEKFFDFTLCVYCTKAQQISRLQKKGFSKKAALQRISSQIPLTKKIKLADFVIYNNKSLKDTIKQLNKLIDSLELINI